MTNIHPTTDALESSPANEPSPQVTKQSNLHEFMKRPLSDKKNQDITFSLVETIVKDYLPFQIVDSASFKTFISKLNNSYCLPNRKRMSNVLIPQVYNMTKETVKNSIANGDSYCMTTDGWTSVANESYICVMAHFVNEQMEFKSHLLSCISFKEKHTAENLAEELKRVAQHWEINDKVVAIVSDNAANMVAAIKLTGWKNIPCFAHNINLIVQSGLQEIKEIHSKVKSIVEFFKTSTQATENLTKTQIQLSEPVLHLKKDVITRWNSTYDMFARKLEVKNSLMTTIAISYPNVNNVTSDDLDLISKCCDILKVFKDVTEEMSSEKEVTASKIILLSQALRDWYNKCLAVDLPDCARALGEKLLEAVNKRFRGVEEHVIFSEATFLDPRFKKYGFIDPKCFDRTKEALINRISSTKELMRRLTKQIP